LHFVVILIVIQWKSQTHRPTKFKLFSRWCICVVHVFLSCWAEVDVAAQIQQWFHPSTAKMPFLQTATARYDLNWKIIENYPGEILVLNVEPHKFIANYF
jgi:hypothetical protein